MPVRKIPPSYRSIRGMHPWRRPGRSIGFESTLERDFITTMMFEPSVADIEEQPVTIDYVFDNRRRHYTPDYLVKYLKHAFTEPQHEIIEIKYRKDLKENWLDYRRKFEAARSWAEKHKMRFRILTEHALRGPRLENLKYLIHFYSAPPDANREERIHCVIAGSGSLSFSALLGRLSDSREEQAYYRRSVLRLLALRNLIADLNVPLDQTTLLSIGTNKA